MIRIVLVLVAVSLAAACQDTVPQASGGSQKMQLEQNKTIARAYLHELVNANDVAAAERYFPPSATFNGSTITGQQLSAGMQATRKAFPDFRLTIADQIAEGDKVVTRVIFHGTHRGEFNGVAATGREVTWPGIAIDRIVDGKVVEMWHVQNRTVLLQQLNAAPTADSR